MTQSLLGCIPHMMLESRRPGREREEKRSTERCRDTKRNVAHSRSASSGTYAGLGRAELDWASALSDGDLARLQSQSQFNSLARLGKQLLLAGAALVSAELHFDDRPGYGLPTLTATPRSPANVTGIALFGPTKFGRGHGVDDAKRLPSPGRSMGLTRVLIPGMRGGIVLCVGKSSVGAIPSFIGDALLCVTVDHGDPLPHGLTPLSPDHDSLPVPAPRPRPRGNSWRGFGRSARTHMPKRGTL